MAIIEDKLFHFQIHMDMFARYWGISHDFTSKKLWLRMMVDEWGPGGLKNLSWFYTHEKIPILLVWVPEVLLAQSPGARTLTTQAIGGQIFCKLHLPTMIATPQKDTKKCFQEGSSMIFKSLRSDKMMIHIYIYYHIYIFIYLRVSGVQRSIYVALVVYQAYPAQI